MLKFIKKNRFFYLLVIASIFNFGCGEDDSPPTEPTLPVLSAADITVTETDNDFDAIIKLVLTGTNNANVVLKLATADGTADLVSDYKSIEDSEIIFSPGETQKDLLVKIKGDEIIEPEEFFTIQFISIANATSNQQSVRINILDNDEIAVNTDGLQIPDSGFETPMSYDNMTLVWNDEFEGTSLNLNDWTFETGTGNGGWGNNELQFYREENTYFSEGNLIIEAKREVFGGRDYTSSRIKTQGKKEFQYGRVDIRAALPTAKGMWPALWMLGANINDVSWPACGEIDIMEWVGQQPDRVHGTCHWRTNDGNQGSYGLSTAIDEGSSFDSEYHVYSLIWQENNIKILIDDEEYFEIVANDPAEWPFNAPFFFIINSAVGGNWPVNPDNSSPFPQYLIVDYIRVFQ